MTPFKVLLSSPSVLDPHMAFYLHLHNMLESCLPQFSTLFDPYSYQFRAWFYVQSYSFIDHPLVMSLLKHTKERFGDLFYFNQSLATSGNELKWKNVDWLKI